MWTGRRLWVVLYGKRFPSLYLDARHGVIIEVHMGHFYQVRVFYILSIHRKTVILRSHFTLTRHQVFHRVVEPAVAIVHLKSRDAAGKYRTRVYL